MENNQNQNWQQGNQQYQQYQQNQQQWNGGQGYQQQYNGPNNYTSSIEIKPDGFITMWVHVVLSLVTLGIWRLIWVYKTTKYLNRAPGMEYYNPTTKLLLFMFVPFYSFYWYYRTGQKMERVLESQGKNPSDMVVLSVVFGIFIEIVAMILIQDKINDTCAMPCANFNQYQQQQAQQQAQWNAQQAQQQAQWNAQQQAQQQEYDRERNELNK